LYVVCLQIPTFGFLYVAGWIGYVGRLYLNAVRRSVQIGQAFKQHAQSAHHTKQSQQLACMRSRAAAEDHLLLSTLQQLCRGTDHGLLAAALGWYASCHNIEQHVVNKARLSTQCPVCQVC
jgi:hypothetical protein